MTDEAFKELINLYLDGELSLEEELRLNTEVNASPERSRQFHEACRLHDAMQMVLDPQALQPKDLDAPLPWARILCGLGVAACVAMGTLLIVPAMLVNDGVEEGDSVIAEDIEPVQVRGYVTNQREQTHRCSLAAQLRLVGLMPELTPEDSNLQPVKSSAVVRRRVIVMRDLKLSDPTVETITVIEEPKAAEVYRFPAYPESRSRVRSFGGVEATLVSF